MFKYWNFPVNRSETPFFSIEADLALEHENIAVNVLGGIKGIRKNEIALNDYFLSAARMGNTVESFYTTFTLDYKKTKTRVILAIDWCEKFLFNNIKKLTLKEIKY